ncbi:hypothetical protein ACFL5X_03640 [Candidatus Omnitrophota bacterium]
MSRKSFSLYAILVLAVLFNGCAAPRTITDKVILDLYGDHRATTNNRVPGIFIPGVLGSVLKKEETGKVLWGEGWGVDFHQLALPIDGRTLKDNEDSIEAVWPVENISIIPGLVKIHFYRKLLDIGTRAGGYNLGTDAFTLPYDWRRDLVEAAQQLGQLIERIKEEKGQPDLKFDLICHSAGGLIARYYVKYGSTDVLDQDPLPLPSYEGARHINRVILLGTPNRGSLDAFKLLHTGMQAIGAGSFSSEVLFTMPAIYQLFPHEDEFVFLDNAGNSLDVSLYDEKNWEKYGWSVFRLHLQSNIKKKLIRKYGEAQGAENYKENLGKQKQFLKKVLKRAKQFHQALWNGEIEEEKEKVKYYLLGANCLKTQKKAILKNHGSEWDTRFKVKDPKVNKMLFGFGDELVTKDSFLGLSESEKGRSFPAYSSFFVCTQHKNLTENPTYIDNILHLLLEQ